MTGRSSERDETRNSAESDGEVLDELLEPATGLRTAQEREPASGGGSVGREDVGTGDISEGAGLDELFEPASELRTAQEREAGETPGDVGAEGEDQVGGRDE